MFRTIKNGQMVAGVSFKGKAYVQVKISNKAVVVCGAGEAGIGVIQNEPEIGEAAELVQYGETLIRVGGTIAENAIIGSDANGKAVALTVGTDSTKYQHGRIIDAVTGTVGANRLTRAFVDMVSPSRAA